LSVSRFLLSIRSPYFRSMFSDNNNFVESQTGRVKMPYSKAVLEKVVIYLYTGKMNCEEMTLGALLDLMDLLNLTNLPKVFEAVENFSISKMKKGEFPLSDCLKSLDDCSRLGLETVGETLLIFLGRNFVNFCQDEAVGTLSGNMLFRLLEERTEIRDQTIVRFRALVTWLSFNLEAIMKADLLKMFDFDHFTTEELATDVRKSGLYEKDRIIERMGELYQIQSRDNKTEMEAREEKYETEMEAREKKYETELAGQDKKMREYREDIKTIKMKTNRMVSSTFSNAWRDYVPGSIKNKYQWE